MRKNTKYVNGNVEYAMCPFFRMKIVQGSNGKSSHKGSYAIDVTDLNKKYRTEYYAPCKMKCVRVDKTWGFVWWNSCEKVETTRHGRTYITVMFGHENDVKWNVGDVIEQGEVIGHLGDYFNGNGNGIHCHVEVAPILTDEWHPNEYGQYILNGSVEFEDVFYMDDTMIFGKGKWVYI